MTSAANAHMTAKANAHMTAGSSLDVRLERIAEEPELDEVWLPIPGSPVVEGRVMHEVSNLGRIRSWFAQGGRGANRPRVRTSPRVLAPCRYRNGYLGTTLAGRGVMVHEVVLEAFVGPRPPGHQCAHWDGDRFNNALTNLRWATPRENAADKRRHGTEGLGEANGKHVLSEEVVLQARWLARTGVPITHIAEAKGFALGTIWQAIRGQTWAHLPGAVPASNPAS
jgi:hypothetical protein